MRTKALITTSPGSGFQYTTLTLDDEPNPDEVHVRIHATGICHTDIIFSREPTPDFYPGIFGHEGAGVIQRVGSSVSHLSPGDRVILVYSCCGECEYCEAKQTGYCDRWFQFNFGIGRGEDGSKSYQDRGGRSVTGHFFGQSSFARDVYVKETAVVKVPEGCGFGFERLAPLACGVMTGAGAMVNTLCQFDVGTQKAAGMRGKNVVVVGVGAVGLSAVMALGLLRKEDRPKRVIAVDIVPKRLELARECGATHGVNSKLRSNLMQVLLEITDGEGVHGAIDLTGREDVVSNLVHACARRGKIVQVATGGTKGVVKLNMFEMVQAGAQYVGCQQGDCYPQEFLPMLLQAHQDGKFPYHKLVRTYGVRDIEQAVEDMEDGSTIKPVLIWD